MGQVDMRLNPNAGLSYTRVNVPQRVMALTFDDGPHATLTPRLLDLLRQRGVHATFFLIGQNVRMYPHLVRRILAEGHEVGNHTYTHPQLNKKNDQQVREEIEKTNNAIQMATGGYYPQLMRPPYGATNQHLKEWFRREYHQPTILWDVDPLDWKDPGASVVAQRILSEAKQGSIVLSHDIHAGTVQAMPQIIDTLRARGFGFVTVSQLINMGLQMQGPPMPQPSQYSPGFY